MRYAKVITLSISGLRNRIFNCGDEVNEEQFPAGRFDELLANGGIQFFRHDGEEANIQPGDVQVNRVPVVDVPQGIKEGMATIKDQLRKLKVEFDNDSTLDELNVILAKHLEKKDEEPVKTPEQESQEAFDDTTRKEIMAELDKMGVKYNKNATKNELYDLFRANKK